MTPGLKPEKNQNNSPVKPYRIWPSKTALAKSPTNIQLNKTPLENTPKKSENSSVNTTGYQPSKSQLDNRLAKCHNHCK